MLKNSFTNFTTQTSGLVRRRCWDPWPWCCPCSGGSSCPCWRICHCCQWSQGMLKDFLLKHLSCLFHFSQSPTMVDLMWLQYLISLSLCHRWICKKFLASFYNFFSHFCGFLCVPALTLHMILSCVFLTYSSESLLCVIFFC